MADEFLSNADQQKAVEYLDKTLGTWIKWVAGILVLFFGYLEIQNAPLDKITQAFDDSSFTKLGLYIFFAGWALGATDDTRIQTTVYALDPNGGKLGSREFVGIGLFLIMFASLFLVHEHLIWFQVALLVFLLTNMWTYSVIIMSRAEPMIRKSAEHYLVKRDYCRYMKLYCAIEYLTGGWQRRRFLTLLALALVQLLVAIFLSFGQIPQAVAGVPVGGTTVGAMAGYVPSALFVIYVILSEAWMKIYRFKVFADFETLDEVEEHFKLTKERAIDLPPINYANLFRRGRSYHEAYR